MDDTDRRAYWTSSRKRSVTGGNPGPAPQSLARHGAESHRAADRRGRDWWFYRAPQTRSRTDNAFAPSLWWRSKANTRPPCSNRCAASRKFKRCTPPTAVGTLLSNSAWKASRPSISPATHPAHQGNFEFRDKSAAVDAQDLTWSCALSIRGSRYADLR